MISKIMTLFPTQHFFPMNNVIQHYSWGSHTAIRDIFGIANPDNQPQAEVWMGAHPNGCSTIVENGEEYRLSDFINLDKSGILNTTTDIQFGELPYLFKILAAEKALSIQVHPNKMQAEQGFWNEEAAGIPLGAWNRNYKDPNHKPELVYALTPYQAMNGFRQFDEIVALFKRVHVMSIDPLVTRFANDRSEAGLREFFQALFSLPDPQKEVAINELLTFVSHHTEDDLFALIASLSEQYPGDIGLFCPLLLNVLTLNPGEAMFLEACTPHAYLHGTALEIMASSDNVLRSGLTSKYMDIEALVQCTHFSPKSLDHIRTEPEFFAGGQFYPVPVDDFKFAIFSSPDKCQLITESAEILLALDADLTLYHVSGETLRVSQGQSVFIPAFSHQYQMTSAGRVARAFN